MDEWIDTAAGAAGQTISAQDPSGSLKLFLKRRDLRYLENRRLMEHLASPAEPLFAVVGVLHNRRLFFQR